MATYKPIHFLFLFTIHLTFSAMLISQYLVTYNLLWHIDMCVCTCGSVLTRYSLLLPKDANVCARLTVHQIFISGIDSSHKELDTRS